MGLDFEENGSEKPSTLSTFDSGEDWTPSDYGRPSELAPEKDNSAEIEEEYIFVDELDTSVPVEFGNLAKARQDGPTFESFLHDVDMCSKILSKIRPIKGKAYREEIESMEIKISESIYNAQEIQMKYSQILNYRHRLDDIKKHVDAYYNICSAFMDEFKKMASSLGRGKTIPANEAYAANLMIPLSQRCVLVKTLKDEITNKYRTLESSHQALGNIIKMNEAEGRVNFKYQESGTAARIAENERENN